MSLVEDQLAPERKILKPKYPLIWISFSALDVRCFWLLLLRVVYRSYFGRTVFA